MKLLLVPIAALALAGCAQTSTPPVEPSVTVAQLSAFNACEKAMDSVAVAIRGIEQGNTATMTDAANQLDALAPQSPSTLAAQFTSFATLLHNPVVDDATMADGAQPILDECKSVVADTAAAQTEQAAPAGTVGEGTWTVGVDVPAGTYRTVDPVSDGCYWEITKAGSNGNDIIANDNVSGGRPTVTLKSGQEFVNNGCGTFAKV